MMKKRLVALLVAAMMLVGIFPVVAMAASEDITFTTATLGDKTFTPGTAYADQSAIGEDAELASAGSVTVTDGADLATEIVLGNATTVAYFKVAKVAAASIADAVTTVETATEDTDLAATTFADGDYLVIGVDDNGDGAYAAATAVYYVVKVTVSAPAPDTGADASGDLELETEIKDVIYVVTVPTTLKFAIDPYQVDDPLVAGSQVGGYDFGFTSATKAPVKLDLTFEATLGDEVALVDDAETLSPDDISVTDKKLYLAAIGAKSFEDEDLTGIAYDAADHQQTPCRAHATRGLNLPRKEGKSGKVFRQSTFAIFFIFCTAAVRKHCSRTPAMPNILA